MDTSSSRATPSPSSQWMPLRLIPIVTPPLDAAGEITRSPSTGLRLESRSDCERLLAPPHNEVQHEPVAIMIGTLERAHVLLVRIEAGRLVA